MTKCEASVLEEVVKKVGKKVVNLVGSKRYHKAAVVELHERLDALQEVERDGEQLRCVFMRSWVSHVCYASVLQTACSPFSGPHPLPSWHTSNFPRM